MYRSHQGISLLDEKSEGRGLWERKGYKGVSSCEVFNVQKHPASSSQDIFYYDQ